MTSRFLGALQFLTVLPIRTRAASPGTSAALFPLVGALLGGLGGLLYRALSLGLPESLAALLIVLFWVAATGALHEDGLADVADAFRAHRSPDRIHAILKDSRIGTFGGLALVFSVALRWRALVAIGPENPWLYVGAQALPRAAMVLLAYTARPIGSGLGADFCRSLTATTALAVTLQALVAAALFGPVLGLTALILLYFTLRFLLSYFHARIGGIVGDCLGAAEQITECLTLLLLASGRSLS